jgi:uncharacterized glyoxalase superfamily protein PhnB
VQRAFAARAVGRGSYRASVVFPAAGRWTYAARIGAKRYPLGSATVREAPVRLVASADVVIDRDGSLVVADVRHTQVAPSGGVVTQLIKLRVPDVDAAFARARDAGARVLEEPQTHVYGERSCVVEDPAGHRWELTQTVRDVDPSEWGGVAVAPW